MAVDAPQGGNRGSGNRHTNGTPIQRGHSGAFAPYIRADAVTSRTFATTASRSAYLGRLPSVCGVQRLLPLSLISGTSIC